MIGLGNAARSSSLLEACSQAVSLVGPTLKPAKEPNMMATSTAEPTTALIPQATVHVPEPMESLMTQVALVKTDDRASGIKTVLNLIDNTPVQGKDLFLKPNFNSADPPPGSTHNDTLQAVVLELKTMGAVRITVGDRSGMGDTSSAMRQMGIFRMAEELGFETVVFDELDDEGWERMQFEGQHWQNGFAVARPVLEADGVVQTCCLKTHRYGGHFTMSLKNSVGLIAKHVPGEGHNYMNELHGSPYQRSMIAEINTAYQPDLIILDGIEAFVDGGPARGTRVSPQIILGGTDRVAIDAVGVAILRSFGTTPEVSQGPIFQQEQIARAVELGLGIQSPHEIELVTSDPESESYALELGELLVSE